MAIPDFQSIMLPLLSLASDQTEHYLPDARENLATHFELTEEERAAMLPSGTQRVFANRVAWAKVYLQQAGLLDSARRGYFRITDKGSEVLEENPERIDTRYLRRFPQFLDFLKRRSTGKEGEDDEEDTKTPEEIIAETHRKLRRDLASDLLGSVKSSEPQFFEKLVVELLLKMGYGGGREQAGKALGKVGDEGLDGVINEDRLGLDVIYLQAKRWEGNIGRPEIQKFVGALQGKRAKKGVFITTSTFTPDAREYVSHVDPKVILIDGQQLADLMIDFDIGVSTVDSYEVKKRDTDFFGEE